MSKQTIYLKDDIEDKIREVSNREGRPISEVIRRRVESSFRQEELIDRLESKIDSIYAALQFLSADLGYTAGAMRASTRGMEAVRIEGATHENTVKQTISSLGQKFKEKFED